MLVAELFSGSGTHWPLRSICEDFFVGAQKKRDKRAKICFEFLMKASLRIPDIPEEERTPLVVALLEIIRIQQEQIQELRDEIARLKGQKPRPKIKPSSLEKHPEKTKKNCGSKRPGSDKRKKTDALVIHKTMPIEAPNVPPGSEFRGYEDFTVQGLLLQPHNILYRRERWLTAQGAWIVASLPDDVKKFGHFDGVLQGFALYQYYHCHVTQPLILEQLLELGVDISAGQVNRIITEGKERFHKEKDEILRTGLEISSYINTDDTGARHKGKNGYCAHIGNEMFAWFQSAQTKSRLNFLTILRAGHEDYALNQAAFDYMRTQKLPKAQLDLLAGCGKSLFEDHTQWREALESLGFSSERHIRIATEGALLGSIRRHGHINPNLVILSDDAGQFDVLLHALCWIHAERPINKLVGFNDAQREALDAVRTQIWEFYSELKTYKQAPDDKKKSELEERFDEIFTTRTCYETLNQALQRIYKNKSELLLVLERPDVPLHNNASERDIREYVKKRLISGSTRSDLGRHCRDTFASLKKTCRKLGVGFWEYLKDRLSGMNSIPWLPELMRLRITESPG